MVEIEKEPSSGWLPVFNDSSLFVRATPEEGDSLASLFHVLHGSHFLISRLRCKDHWRNKQTENDDYFHDTKLEKVNEERDLIHVCVVRNFVRVNMPEIGCKFPLDLCYDTAKTLESG